MIENNENRIFEESIPVDKIDGYFFSREDYILGIDEAGRGALAGPVTVAGILVHKNEVLPKGINDSKTITAINRTKLGNLLREKYNFFEISIPNDVIDNINILKATLLGMESVAVRFRDITKKSILIDGNIKPYYLKNCSTIVKGDLRSKVIGAASILAKTKRDEIMTQFNIDNSIYNWAQNKGYGTSKHIDLIRQFGKSGLHRMSFLKKY
ncbi:MAG: ribonuclease HII [Candidatus Kapaibacteriales bacterium]